jgi:hypothetical protein
MDEIEELKTQVKTLLAWKAEREKQQLTDPVDSTSQIIIGQFAGVTSDGQASTTLTESIGIASTPATIDVPAAYTGAVFLTIQGATYKVPTIA